MAEDVLASRRGILPGKFSDMKTDCAFKTLHVRSQQEEVRAVLEERVHPLIKLVIEPEDLELREWQKYRSIRKMYFANQAWFAGPGRSVLAELFPVFLVCDARNWNVIPPIPAREGMPEAPISVVQKYLNTHYLVLPIRGHAGGSWGHMRRLQVVGMQLNLYRSSPGLLRLENCKLLQVAACAHGVYSGMRSARQMYGYSQAGALHYDKLLEQQQQYSTFIDEYVTDLSGEVW